MIWPSIVLVCVLALLPSALVLRRRVAARDRQMLALALHRAQLREIERDRAQGLIAESELATARLEIQRRLLAEAAMAPSPERTGSPLPVVAALVLLPVAAVALYRIGGRPDLPAQPVAMRLRQAQSEMQGDERLLSLLRTRLAGLPAGSPQAREGYLLLGQAEATHGDWAAAAAAWQRALDAGFDPTLAAQVAEAQVQASGSVSPQSAALFRRALDQAPRDAPWRLLAEQRIAQSEPH